MATRKKAPVISTGLAYLDPADCDSTIQYKIINGGRRVWSSVQLSDCTRKIDWYFGGDRGEQLAKVDVAIEMLNKFREELSAALIIRKTRKPRARATK